MPGAWALYRGRKRTEMRTRRKSTMFSPVSGEGGREGEGETGPGEKRHQFYVHCFIFIKVMLSKYDI